MIICQNIIETVKEVRAERGKKNVLGNSKEHSTIPYSW